MQQPTMCYETTSNKKQWKILIKRAKSNPGVERSPSYDLLVPTFNLGQVKDIREMPEDRKLSPRNYFVYI